MTQTTSIPDHRCRLVLIVSAETAGRLSTEALAEILSAGDVASVIFTADGLDDGELQTIVESLIKVAQDGGAAAIVADSTRVAGRTKADGIQLGPEQQQVADAIEKFTPQFMVGVSHIKTRHNALVIGELQPDYVMFGKPGGDIRPEPHPKNLDLGNWWSSMVEIPCIVLGGNDVSSVVPVAKTGAEFVALGAAIFAPQDSDLTSSQLVERANQLLDEHAPTFEIIDS